jgi:hypothetical protein
MDFVPDGARYCVDFVISNLKMNVFRLSVNARLRPGSCFINNTRKILCLLDDDKSKTSYGDKESKTRELWHSLARHGEVSISLVHVT